MTDIISKNLVAGIELQDDDVAEAITFVATTAQLAQDTDAINTTGKFQGKQVWNSTTGILVIANGPLATDTWKNAGTGVVAHTPV